MAETIFNIIEKPNEEIITNESNVQNTTKLKIRDTLKEITLIETNDLSKYEVNIEQQTITDGLVPIVGPIRTSKIKINPDKRIVSIIASFDVNSTTSASSPVLMMNSNLQQYFPKTNKPITLVGGTSSSLSVAALGMLDTNGYFYITNQFKKESSATPLLGFTFYINETYSI